jgi:hypothetical protein
MILALLACEPPVEPRFEPLDAALLLRRMSLEFRGVNPSIAELEAASADPDWATALAEAWRTDPRFQARFADLLSASWLTRLDEYRVPGSDFGEDVSEGAFVAAVGDEPLRLAARVAADDLPWTDLVTADYTMANDELAAVFDLEFVEEGQGWRKARYTDARPAGGVLMTNGFWFRYSSTKNNLNRGRAAALARILLCYDVLARPVAFSGISDFTDEALLAATKTDPNCLACHSGIDPLASNLFGFWAFDDRDATELSHYHPERELLAESLLEMEPSFFGTPLPGTASLGPAVAADPRFAGCAVRTMAEAMLHRRMEPDDFATLADLREGFIADGLRMPALMDAIGGLEEFRAGALGAAARDGDADSVATRRVLSPDQMETAVLDLTGFRWTYDGYAQLRSDLTGYRVMAGGVDGQTVSRLGSSDNVTRSLVNRRLAQAAAQAVVERDMAATADERLLLGTVLEDLEHVDVESPEFEAELQRLHLRIHSHRAPADRIEEEVALFAEVQAASGAQQAWSSLVSLLLRDPDFWTW